MALARDGIVLDPLSLLCNFSFSGSHAENERGI